MTDIKRLAENLRRGCLHDNETCPHCFEAILSEAMDAAHQEGYIAGREYQLDVVDARQKIKAEAYTRAAQFVRSRKGIPEHHEDLAAAIEKLGDEK